MNKYTRHSAMILFLLVSSILMAQAQNTYYKTSAKNKTQAIIPVVQSNLQKDIIGTGGFKILNVNNVRNYSITNNASTPTKIYIDGIFQSFQSFDIIGTGGYKIRFKVASDVNPTISQGTLSELYLISDIKGVITSLNPLTVLNQAVFVTSDTQLVNLPDSNLLHIGDSVSVSGAIDALNNSIQLSRLEKHSSALGSWQLRGFVKSITASTFMVGNLIINNNAVVPTPASCSLINNAFVSIKATADATFMSNNALPLATLTSIACEDPDVDQTPNFSVPSVVEGVISDVVSFDSFKINDLLVITTNNTEFDNGEFEHIDVGSKVEVQGLLNTLTREMTAATVRFIHHRIKIIAPASALNIDTFNKSITLLNKTVLATPLTQDNDLVLSNGVITTNRQIEVRGFIDSSGQMYALRIRNKDTADTQQIKLRGDVTAINKPLLEINGIQIDASNSEFQQLSGAVNFDIDTFFSGLNVGMQASIQAAHYNATTQRLTFGTIEISEQELIDNPNSTVKSLGNNIKDIIGTGGLGFASITIPNLIFSGGFE